MAKKILVIGASGLLGSKLFEKLSEDFMIVGTYSKNRSGGLYYYDMTDMTSKIFDEVKPDIVIHAAGMTNVDSCEKNKEKAYKINVEGTKNIIYGCKLNESKLIYISTDFLFDGRKGNYDEMDKPNPLNYYARTKLKAENLIRDSGLDYIIARVAALYGARDNEKFVNWCINQLRKEEYITLVADHTKTPTFVDDIAEALRVLIMKNKQGTYNIAGSESISPFSMGVKIAEVFGFDKKYLKPITSHRFVQKAQRPKNTSLNIGKLEKEGIQMSGFAEGLKKMKEQMK